MPYIKKEDRIKYENVLNSLRTIFEYHDEIEVGEFNYLVSSAISQLLKDKGLNYKNCNGVIGSLECVKLELYRKVIAPYEDEKITENGDVYEDLNKKPKSKT